MEKKAESLTFSKNGSYMLVMVKGKEFLYHLSTPWNISSRIHLLEGDELDEVIKKLLRKF